MSGVSEHTQTRIRDRQTGRIFTETVFGGGALPFFYETLPGRLLVELAMSRARVNALYGWWQRRPGSRRRIPEFVRTLGIDADEADRPMKDYRNLDEFFTRKLRAAARPIDQDAEHLVSPADGRAVVIPRLDEDLRVKGSTVALSVLVGDGEVARRYRGGSALVVRLAPADYHRFHFPDDGVAGRARTVSGRLHSVHAIALAAGAPSFANLRAVTRLDSRGFGPLVVVEVGAMLVGRIEQTFTPGPVARGEQKGLFRFGGSTVIVLAEPGRLAWDDDLVNDTGAGLESLVKMGTRVGVRS